VRNTRSFFVILSFFLVFLLGSFVACVPRVHDLFASLIPPILMKGFDLGKDDQSRSEQVFFATAMFTLCFHALPLFRYFGKEQLTEPGRESNAVIKAASALVSVQQYVLDRTIAYLLQWQPTENVGDSGEPGRVGNFLKGGKFGYVSILIKQRIAIDMLRSVEGDAVREAYIGLMRQLRVRGLGVGVGALRPGDDMGDHEKILILLERNGIPQTRVSLSWRVKRGETRRELKVPIEIGIGGSSYNDCWVHNVGKADGGRRWRSALISIRTENLPMAHETVTIRRVNTADFSGNPIRALKRRSEHKENGRVEIGCEIQQGELRRFSRTINSLGSTALISFCRRCTDGLL